MSYFGIIEPCEEAIELGAFDRNFRVPDGLLEINIFKTDGKRAWFVESMEYTEENVKRLERNGIPVFRLSQREMAMKLLGGTPLVVETLGSWALGELELER